MCSLRYDTKALLVAGCFDTKIKMISAKTLKLLLTLNFHQGIVNKVWIDRGSAKDEIILYSVSEDGYFAQWVLEV